MDKENREHNNSMKYSIWETRTADNQPNINPQMIREGKETESNSIESTASEDSLLK